MPRIVKINDHTYCHLNCKYLKKIDGVDTCVKYNEVLKNHGFDQRYAHKRPHKTDQCNVENGEVLLNDR